MYANVALWGPMFILGIVSLSEFVEPYTSIYIKHVLSNLYIPIYIYAGYQMFDSAVFEGGWWAVAKFAALYVMQFTTANLQFEHVLQGYQQRLSREVLVQQLSFWLLPS